ncbi:MAG: STAS/SEC14 domain-containing protein [Bacteroidetes bacterium]|nr:STAS/SEC14 domain-containing protein [Bacteroidota bacterium]
MFDSYQNIEIIKSVKLDFGTIELRSDDILTFEPAKGITTVNKDQLVIMLKNLIDASNGAPKPFLSDNRNIKSFGFEEREYVAKTIHLFASASAILEDSFVIRFITHTIVTMFKPQIPMKMFKTKESAIEWLRNYN